MQHTPVMVESVVRFLSPKPGAVYVDATLGTGGHTEHILRTGPEGLKVIGVDRDRSALEEAKVRLKRFGPNVTFICGNFRDIKDLVFGKRSDGFLADLGISSFQLSDSNRGFSYLRDGPLDMSMGENGRSVQELLATAGEREIRHILRSYGEERRSGAVAREIVKARSSEVLTRTRQLRALVEKVVPPNQVMQALSRVFQALRIWANGELENLQEFLPQAVELLNPGGRLVVISYHSLEDRIVKHFFKQEEKGCICPPDFPECRCGRTGRLRVVTRRPVRPSPEEIEDNPRSRSARLRAAERI